MTGLIFEQDTSFEGAASTCQQVLRDPKLLSNCQRYQIVKYILDAACILRDHIALTGLLVFGSLYEDHYETGLSRSATQLAYLPLIS